MFEVDVGFMEFKACDYDSIYRLGEKIAEALDDAQVPECGSCRIQITYFPSKKDEEVAPTEP